jgi:RimJ/RimL family protein N-acetyltransferase
MYSLYPYEAVDGIPTYRDSDLHILWDKMGRDNTLRRAFFDGTADTFWGFKQIWMNQHNKLFVCYKADDEGTQEVCALAWLTGLGPNPVANIHYVIFKEFWGKDNPAMIDHFIDLIFEKTGLMIVYGITPVSNRLACRMVDKLGFTKVGVLPMCCYDAYHRQAVDGLISYRTRKE